ncbi:hypothetical protein VTO73DRAFT_6445 [Trametes versicolor]
MYVQPVELESPHTEVVLPR